MNEETVQELKEARMKLSQERRVPPYVVFWNSHIDEMIRQKPQTQEELAKIIGPKRAEVAFTTVSEVLDAMPVEEDHLTILLTSVRDAIDTYLRRVQ